MKQTLLVAALICAALIAGCSGVGTSQSTSPSTSEVATDSPDVAPRLASIPSLEFVIASELGKGGRPKPGATLVRGSYKPVMTGKQITSVQWVVGEAEGINSTMLSLQFDAKGQRDFKNLIESTADKDILFVLNGRVVGALALYESVSAGAITIGSPQIVAARAQIDSATVPPK